MLTTQCGQKSDSAIKQLIEKVDEVVLKRAQWETFEFEIEASGLVKVINSSYEDPEEHTYRVQVNDGLPVACECPHFRFNDDVDLCKHSASLLLREPVLKAAKSQQQEVAGKAMIADGGQVITYTQHVEPPEQGGKKYVRCGCCGRELLVDLGGIDSLSHKEDCEMGQ